jgi:hypothetical protein
MPVTWSQAHAASTARHMGSLTSTKLLDRSQDAARIGLAVRSRYIKQCTTSCSTTCQQSILPCLAQHLPDRLPALVHTALECGKRRCRMANPPSCKCQSQCKGCLSTDGYNPACAAAKNPSLDKAVNHCPTNRLQNQEPPGTPHC